MEAIESSTLAQAASRCHAHQQEAGVRDQRRARVAQHGDHEPLFEQLEQLRQPLALVVVVQLDHALPEAEVGQQASTVAGVFTGHHVGLFERLDGPGRDVLEVADRRADDDDFSAHIFQNCTRPAAQ